MVICEVCVEGIQGARAAWDGAAHRIELCAGLVEGGTTPSNGTVEIVLDLLEIPTVVLVRPRGGDFLYDEMEMDVIIADVRRIRRMGAFGIATGVLRADGTVDGECMARIRDAAGPMSLTFHRAFDMVRDPLEAMEALEGIGVDRVLTSGRRASVMDALPQLRDLVRATGEGLSVMPGGGIRPENIREVVEETGAREVHFTAMDRWDSPMLFRNPAPRMGSDTVPGEFERIGTSAEQVKRMVELCAPSAGTGLA